MNLIERFRDEMLHVYRVHLFDGILTVFSDPSDCTKKFSFHVNEKDDQFNWKGDYYVCNSIEGVFIYDYKLRRIKKFTVPEYTWRE